MVRYSGMDRLAKCDNPPTLLEVVGTDEPLRSGEGIRQYLRKRKIPKKSERRRADCRLRERRENDKKVLRAYEEMLASGEEMNLSRIGARAGLRYDYVRSALIRGGIDPKKVSRGRVVLSEKQKEAMGRGLKAGYSSSDLSYFLKVPFYDIENYRKGENADGVKYGRRDGKKEILRRASMVYEALDAGFSPVETSEIFGFYPSTVYLKRKGRTEIEPKIIKLLRTIYPNRQSDLPYMSSLDIL